MTVSNNYGEAHFESRIFSPLMHNTMRWLFSVEKVLLGKQKLTAKWRVNNTGKTFDW